MLLRTSLRDAKIGTKFNLVMIAVFILGISLSGAALSTVLQQQAQAEVTSKALILIQTMNSVRKYTEAHINPLLAPGLETEPAFIPETVPAFSATEVFEKLRNNELHKNFLYKEATLNPTNLRDKADDFETKLVEQFRSQPETKKISGFRTLPGGKVFYTARPLQITQQKCLECHSTPEAAPASLLATYGAANGFGWKLNDIVAAQIISVPANEVFDSARKSFYLIMGVLLGIFAAVVLLFNFLLKKAVILRIRKIAKTAQAVSAGEVDSSFEENSKDEIGALTVAFNRMKSSLQIAMKLLNQKER